MAKSKILLFLFALVMLSCGLHVDDKLKYLKQSPPSVKPEVFAPGLISKDDEYEFGSVFNKAGTEFFYAVVIDGKEEIRHSKLEGESWTAPKVILSHERYGYNDPFLSPDEKRLYFISKRALDGVGAIKDYDIWYVEKTAKGWSNPINAGPNINTESEEYYISFTANGTMYFSSDKAGNNHDIYYSKMVNGKFQQAVALGSAINTPQYEADVFVDPNERYLIFCSTRRDGLGRGDLYISFKDENGNWTKARNMGNEINTAGHELCPYVTSDGKYFFYTSNKDIYWVSTEIFAELRE
ncbi:MAG: glycoside hydrolase [Bacteroidia bacterium]|nr:glycoside hydrolase [Bacteroidia bacterium]